MPVAAKKGRRKPTTVPERETRAALYEYLIGQPDLTPRETFVRMGPELMSDLWQVNVIMNTGDTERVRLEIRPRLDNRAGFMQHSHITNGVTFDCRVEAVLDFSRVLHDTAHVLGRLGAPVAAAIG